jgi:sec-independent protein translocase protein TatB
MFGIGIQEFGLILVVALLVFGPKRLPELARMLGRGMGEFRRASNDLRQSLALDDLEKDIRRDLNSAKSLLKPDLMSSTKSDPAMERPAQAGDGLDAASTPVSEPAVASREKHPGELPLGNDHEHHPDSEPDSEPASAAEPKPRSSSETEDLAVPSDGASGVSGASDAERG